MIVAGKRKKIPVAGREVSQHLPIYLSFNSAALSHPIFFDTYHLFLAIFRTFFIFFFSFSVLASHILDNIHNRDNQQSYNDQQYNTYNHSFFFITSFHNCVKFVFSCSLIFLCLDINLFEFCFLLFIPFFFSCSAVVSNRPGAGGTIGPTSAVHGDIDR